MTLPAEPEIRNLVAAYDRSIQDLGDPLARENPAGRKLYETLVAPAKAVVAKTGRVILVPDGVLYSLNFETLPVPGDKPHYWIEDASIAIAPSLGLLKRRDKGAVGKALLLMGNPVSPDAEFPNLAYAAREMKSIAGSFPLARTIGGLDAKPAAWAQSHPEQFDLIHFTAHAKANLADPLESAVILSRDPADGTRDYRLRARDIVNTRLKAHLVTISACRSAGTRIYSGEGLVGLAWAFMEAGAHNVIAGLWDVNDETSPRLMAPLYRGLAQGRTPADALRAAKLDLVHAGGVHRKPWYWGAFQLFTTEID